MTEGQHPLARPLITALAWAVVLLTVGYYVFSPPEGHACEGRVLVVK